MTHFLSCVAVTLLVSLNLEAVHGFGGLTNTKCNIDPSRGMVNNPCGTLYDADCVGRYCECPAGWKEHVNLRRCVRVSSAEFQEDDNDMDIFDDIPFDYVPPNKKKTSTIEETACRVSFACHLMYNAVCRNGFCKCPYSTVEVNGKCQPRSYDNDDDEDNDRSVFYIRRSGSKMIGSDVLVTAGVTFLALIVTC